MRYSLVEFLITLLQLSPGGEFETAVCCGFIIYIFNLRTEHPDAICPMF
jgi:hypothetical protein